MEYECGERFLVTREKQLTDLGMAALGLLVERPMHPYEMYQTLLHRRDDMLVKVRPGTLYHAVGRLAEAGLVTAIGTQKDGNRPERTTYALLPAGKQALETRLMEMLANPVNEFPGFPQAIAEAHNLGPDVVLDLLGQRVSALRAQLAEFADFASGSEAATVERFFWIHVGYQISVREAEIKWIEQLCADIRSGDLPWPVLDGCKATTTNN